jgi:steroid 5-alpha reductase family enzyme
MLWWSYYLFSVPALGGESVQAWFYTSIVGVVLLTLLFQSSTPFTEEITLKKVGGN